jgi:hypothetical protein
MKEFENRQYPLKTSHTLFSSSMGFKTIITEPDQNAIFIEEISITE